MGTAKPRRVLDLPDLNAPVTARELQEALGISRQAVTKAAGKGRFGESLTPGVYVFALASLPEDARRKVTAARKARQRERVREALAPSALAPVFEPALDHFTTAEQEAGGQRRDFVLEVELTVANDPRVSKRDAVDRIVRRELALERAGRVGDLKYPLLLSSGKNLGIALSWGNYNSWHARWRPWRRGDGDRANWWCLCPRYRGHTRERFGDDRFWRKFAALYECETRRDMHNSYLSAREFSIRAGVSELNIPSERQVRFFYETKVDPHVLAARRNGPKHVYDQLDSFTMRDWSKVSPDECWTADGHICNVFVRYFDAMAGPIDPATALPTGGWRWCRPVLTQWMDAKTWKTVGHIFTRVSSKDSIEIALRRAIDKRGAVPLVAYYDCGRDYQAFGGTARGFAGSQRMGYDADRAKSVCEALGIRAIMALPYNPRAKLNERFFRAHEVFMQRWPSYTGMRKEQMDKLWRRKTGTDNLCLQERVETYPEGHKLAGCLVRPEALPTMEHFEAEYLRWLEEVWNKRPSKGRVNFGASPDETYYGAKSAGRDVSAEDVSLAFLEVYATRKVARGGYLHWCPPNGTKPDWKFYQDPELVLRRGEYVQLRVDKRWSPAPRLFVFERVRQTIACADVETWRQIKCSGPLGSVPNTAGMEAFAGDAEQYLEAGRKRAQWKRKIKAGVDAADRLDVMRDLEASVNIERGESATGRREDGTFRIAAERKVFVPQTARKAEEAAMRKAVDVARKAVPADLAAAYRGEEENEKAER
jgi:hypothetical protein